MSDEARRKMSTLKALNSKAQGRRDSGAPWAAANRDAPTLKGSHSKRLVRPFQGRAVVVGIVNPGCAAGAATLGYGIQPFQGSRVRNHSGPAGLRTTE